MTKEIEKKYLIMEEGINYATQFTPNNLFPCRGRRIRQGYFLPQDLDEILSEIGQSPNFAIEEARLRQQGIDFYLTFKGNGDLERDEENLEISCSFFNKFWPKTQGRRIEKIRLKIPYGKYFAEIDIYSDRKLITAEVEVPTLQEAERLMPLGKDVTQDKKYKNKNLAK